MSAAVRPKVLVLAGPTGTGKTALALELAVRLPAEIISVDSAQVYRGMDIGTAKPDAATRARVPHHLLDIRDPAGRYSAGEFVRDALALVAEVRGRGRVPMLVGGTMLYLRALLAGMAPLPPRSPAVRNAIDAEARERGWPALHAQLGQVDPAAAARIHANDAQRIQRALEVWRLTGRAISDWQSATEPAAAALAIDWRCHALVPDDRDAYRLGLAQRLDAMLEAGFVAEVDALHRRGDLGAELPSIRSVGYRQLWEHVAGRATLGEARERALHATRQLAKRQQTWLRSERHFSLHAAGSAGLAGAVEADLC